jgi:hypothetical protein
VNRTRDAFQAKPLSCGSRENEILSNKADILNRWKEYFQNLCGMTEENLEKPPKWTVPSTDEVEEIPLPTLEEVNFVVLKLKNNKASGPDGLNAELLKVDEMSRIHRLWKLIENKWKEEIFPSQWEKGLICPIYKKGDRMMCENYRGICLPNTAYKVFCYIISKITTHC